MEIKKLNSAVISKIRSSSSINSVAQCVYELVCNSLDAKSGSVAVRINLLTFKIQVADNGEGITKENLELLGIRYMTNKCHNLVELEKHLNTYGFRGETLASLVDMCKCVSISSRCKSCSETYSTTLSKGLRSRVRSAKHRASVGTTVTVLGFLSTFPVRQQRVIQEIELEEVKKNMENLVIINPGTSFSLRNDVTGLLMLNSPTRSDIIDSFRHLHPDISDSFTLLKISKNKVSVDILIHEEFIVSKKFQYVYVNKRPILSRRILKNANNSFYKKMQLKTKRNKHPIYETKRYPIFVLNIKCPQSDVDVLVGPSKSDVEFKCWDLVLNCLEKVIKAFFGLDNQEEHKVADERSHDVKTSCGVSQVVGAVQACAYKRKGGEDILKNDNSKDVSQNSPKNKPSSNKKSKLTCLKDSYACQLKRNSKVKRLPSFVKDKTAILTGQNAKLSGNYAIDDSGNAPKILKPRKLKSIIKKPLPIKVAPKTHHSEPKTNCDSQKEETIDHQLVRKYQFDQTSIYSKLNTNEEQGKDLIMDMFLKSTQVFTGENGHSKISEKMNTNISGDTIEESNFVLENNIQDTVRRVNTTMSISVNVKKKRLNDLHKVSKCVQTSIAEDRLDKLTSKCVQTSQKPTLVRGRSNLSDLTHQFDGFKLRHDVSDTVKDNYTILINTVRKRREFKFVRKSEEMDIDFGEGEAEEHFGPFKICHCHEDDGKIFKFDKGNKREDDESKRVPLSTMKEKLSSQPVKQTKADIPTKYLHNREENEAIFRKPQNLVALEPRLRVENQNCENKIRRNKLNFQGITKQPGPKLIQNIDMCDRSPYFANKSNQRQLSFCNNNLKQKNDFIQMPYQNFQPRVQSTQFPHDHFPDGNLNIVQNNVVSSPYFVGNLRKHDDFSKINNGCWPEKVINDRFQFPNVNNQLQNDLPIENSKRFHGTEYCALEYDGTRQNCFMRNNVCPTKHNCCRFSNANLVPCCHESVYAPNSEANHQYIGLSKGLQCCKNYGHFNSELKAVNVFPKGNLICLEQGNFARSDQNKPIEDAHWQENVYAVRSNYDHANLDFDKKKRQSIQLMEEKEHNFYLEEVPWYTPVLSDENRYFERTLSDSKEARYEEKATVFDDVQNFSEEPKARKCDRENQNIGGEKRNFNFKFSCTPDIFSSNTIYEIERNPDENQYPSNKVGDFSCSPKNDVNEPVKEGGLNDFFDLASFGIVGSNDANRTTNTVCLPTESSILEVTLLDYQEKNNIMEKEIIDVGKNNRARLFSDEISELEVLDTQKNERQCDDRSRIVIDSQNEWIRKCNEAGKRFYVNRRTGMVTNDTPKIEQTLFYFGKRLDFIPKGMSPVLKEHGKIDRSLSQHAKSKLQDFILESYENELMAIKWQHYIYDDPKKFFEEIYQEKSKQFENEIPTIQESIIKNKRRGDAVDFNKKLFDSMEVIGQIDKKFIAVLENTKKLVVLFDQHAVHERIRVEQFLKEYKGLKAHCKEKLTFFMPRNDLNLLKTHPAYLGFVGLDAEFFTDGLKIVNVPLCLQEKDNSENLSKIVNVLIKDMIEFLRATRGSASQLPKVIQNIINLKACRGAIKFGDSLTNEESAKLLNDLARCNLPFQCAHGRPTLTPVLTLRKIPLKENRNKFNFKKLFKGT